MSFWKEFGLGFKTFFEAIGFVFSKGLWWTLIFPLALNILLLWVGTEFTDIAINKLQIWLLNLANLNSTSWYAIAIKGFISGFIWLIVKMLFFSIFLYFGGYIILILMSPVFAYLSEKTEKIIAGNTYPFNGEQWIRDIVRGILITLRNIFYELVIIILIFIFSFIPVIGWLVALLNSIILFFVSAYFYGFSFMDYSLERKKLNIKQSVKFVRKNKGIAVSGGLIFALSMMFPFCGMLIAPFVSVFSVVGTTIAIQKIENK